MVAIAAQIRKGRKYDQVLAGARLVFLQQGFEGASVDDIAREAGVSKATLYSYVPDKRLLFLEVAKAECCRLADEAEANIGCDCTLREALTIAARTLVDFFTSDFFLRMYRIFVAESERFPELGREFYANGPQLGRERMVRFFEDAEARGLVMIADKSLAADQFAELCRADLFTKRVMGILDAVTDAQKARVVGGAVEMFLARYGRKPD
ncbi:TetR/AcrR family transcriptional regulator [Szabonella alba]|uniref:TetR/AcrR family transcriptional regulator n=1 Tax=Szabonella alba TaxID=2804194 RepID=A0A8K0V4R8_9RHOB|nr:TetR/AcrR family transcriptional regulator [Szabonella alba]MBL4915804.1 TetR/AcrR family transcriptional regulator [Szabonella alba]